MGKAKEKIERMRKALAQERVNYFSEKLNNKTFFTRIMRNNVEVGKPKVDITVSAGIASAEKGDSQEDLIQRADSAMYAAKQSRK